MTDTPRIADKAGGYIAAAAGRPLPAEVIDAAKRCLVDWFGVALAGADSPAARLARRRVASWGTRGTAPILLGEVTAPVAAAFVNATMAHADDFDDTHIPSDAHFGGPTWAAVLALAQQTGATETGLLAAFVTGFEVGAKLGGRRLGHAMQARGFQPTGVMGRLSAAAAAAQLLGLDDGRAVQALALAATQAGGLTGSVGSMAKPLQGGKTAMDGVLAAELAADGMVGNPAIFEPGGGLARAFVQDGFAEIADPDFDAGWEILRNSFKPYACLHGIHPSVDAGRQLAPRLADRAIARVRVEVAPGVAKIGGNPDPRTPLEGKFSVAFCVALALAGCRLMPRDFCTETIGDRAIRSLMDRIDVVPVEGRKMIDSKVALELVDGARLDAEVALSKGHPGNPMGWDDLDAKFTELAGPVLDAGADALLAALHEFDTPGRIVEVFQYVAPPDR